MFDFDEVACIIGAEFFGVFSEKLFEALGAGHGGGFNPSGAKPVSTRVSIEVGAVTFFGAEEESDAIVRADGDEGDMTGSNAIETVAAEAVAEDDGVAGVGRAINGGLELFAQKLWGGVEALREEVEGAHGGSE